MYIGGISPVGDLLSTGTHKRAGISQVAAEMDDLVLRIGRLAYRNPG